MKRLHITLIAFTIIGLFWSVPAKAERPNVDILSFLAGGSAAFGGSGAIYLSQSLLQGQKDGDFPAMLQFLLMRRTLSSCIDRYRQKAPERRTSYKEALRRWNEMQCGMQKCWQNTWLMSLLPTISKNESAGGSSDANQHQMSQQMLQILASSFNKQKGCNDSKHSGIDPMLLFLITQQSGT